MAPTYVIPFVIYLLGTAFIARFGDENYPICYTVVAVVVGGSILYLLRGKQILRPHFRIGWGVAAGLVGIALWIALCHLHLEKQLTALLPDFLRVRVEPSERVGYNPLEHLSAGFQIWSFIAVRLVGIAVLVPIAEELFWRGFLLRWLIDPEWEKIKPGEYTHHSCAIVVLMFTVAHPEWLAAASYCLLINGLLYWKKDLWLCVVAHAVSNLVLAIYVLQTGHWWLW